MNVQAFLVRTMESVLMRSMHSAVHANLDGKELHVLKVRFQPITSSNRLLEPISYATVICKLHTMNIHILFSPRC